MKRTPSFLLGVALMGFCLPASAQTAPASKPETQPVKEAPRANGSAARKSTAHAPSYIKDTAAFRRSGRPADKIRIPVQPVKK